MAGHAMKDVTKLIRALHQRRYFTLCRGFSSLVAAFDRTTQNGEVSRADKKQTGLFGVDELSSSDGFQVLEDEVKLTVDRLQVLASKTHDPVQVVNIFDSLSNEICKVADLAEFVHLTHPDEEFVNAATATGLSLGAIVEKLNTNEGLYNILKSANQRFVVSDSGSDIAKRVAELLLFDFEQSGIHLSGEKKADALSLHDQIKILEILFTRGTSQCRYVPVADCPQFVRHAVPTVNSHVQVDRIFHESDDPLLREWSYRTYMAIDKKQEETLDSLLAARFALAKNLGFDSYGQRNLKGTTVSTPSNAMAFLKELFGVLKPRANADLQLLRSYKARESLDSKVNSIMPYDMHHYMSNIIYDNYKLSSTISEYFSLGTCMEGLSMIFSHLFGIHLIHCNIKEGEVWSSDVLKISVVHESEGVLGYIYCDLFSRPGKIQSESHFTVRGGKVMEDAPYQLPVVCLVCNFPQRSGRPALLSPEMVDNLFHEMGHAMHSMLARTKYQHVAGTRCATDFAEVPSIFLEHFTSDINVLRSISRHYKTGDRLPLDLAHSVVRAKKTFAALDSANQVYYAILDQLFHSPMAKNSSAMEMMLTAHGQYSLLPHVEGTAWHLRFSHFASYGSKYYSYMWSKAVASLIWNRFFVGQPLNRLAGEKYRQTLLSHGGGRPPKEMIEDMLQTELSNELLVKSYLDALL